MALVLAVADLLHRLERPAFVEDGEPAQQPLLRGVEERVAPADRRAQRALAERQVAIARGQKVERVVEPLRAARRARGCARAPRRARARAAGRRGGGRSRRSPRRLPAVSAKPGFTFSARWTKSATDGHVAQRVERRRVLRRQLERRQAELRLRADLERRAARGDHLQRGTAGDERGDVRRGIEHLLEVVEHQEHAAVADDGGERVERRAAVRLGDVERGADRRQHLRRRGDGGERDEGRAAGVLGRQAAEELDREARLAGAAVAGDGEQARAAAQALGGGLRGSPRGRAAAWRASAAASRRPAASRSGRMRRSSLRTSSAVWKRARGSFSRQRATMRSRSGGHVGPHARRAAAACRAGSRS